ncbi:MAG: HAD domain-containing protein [Thiomonas sp.]
MLNLGQGRRVLYLDFDGVLHHENVYRHPTRGPVLHAPAEFRLFQHAELLANLLEPYPDIAIVLSTSWVRVLDFHRSRKRLIEPLRERVIGATFHRRHMRDQWKFMDLPRGIQVLADVQRRQPAAWLALDDDGEGWPDLFRGHLILTDPVHGISAPKVLTEIRRKLELLNEHVVARPAD